MTLKTQATKLVKEWQKRLRLDDWHFKVSINDHTLEHKYASNKFSIADRAGHITITDPRLNPPSDVAVGCDDLEVTVVHELLHTRFATFHAAAQQVSEYADRQIEAEIEMTAQALVAAKRGKTRVV